jgi:hypothetical protein
MAYTTLSDVKEFLGIASANTDDDALLTDLLTTAQAMVENYCGRTFEASSETTRYLDACYPTVIGRVLYLDTDLCAVSSIANGDGSVVTSADYFLRPITPPYSTIHLTVASGLAWAFTGEPWEAIEVTGKWAYSASAPDAVVTATKMIARWLYRQGDEQGQGGALPAEAVALLEAYRRIV